MSSFAATPAFKPLHHDLVLEPLAYESDVQRAVALGAMSYPADEAASEHSIWYCQQHAGAFFLAAFTSTPAGADGSSHPRELVGFVNGTLTINHELEEASMYKHDPLGTTLCVHSVVMDATYRHKGLATSMLQQYVRRVVEQQLHVTRILVLAKTSLVAFYIDCGFVVTKLSSIRRHDTDEWLELAFDCVAARRIGIVQVDAFTTNVFSGNPAAVVVLPRTQFDLPDVSKWMQRVAMETNASETAFAARHNPQLTATRDVVAFDLRLFTPFVEVDMCGHATLSTAFVLFFDAHVAATATIHFHTLGGVLVCRLDRSAPPSTARTFKPSHRQSLRIRMEFPRGTLSLIEAKNTPTTPAALAQALGIAPVEIVAIYRTEQPDVLVHVTPTAFAALAPHFSLLAAFDARGVVVTTEAVDPTLEGASIDFQSRWFGAQDEADEDPVTGSAHCALAVYWASVLGHKTHLRAHQACPSRGGIVTLELPSDRPDIVVIIGDVVVAKRGELMTAP